EGTVGAVGEVLGSSSPQSRLCALHDGQVQCYGEGGPFRQWVEALYEDREGNLWVGGADGLWRWRPGAPQHYVSSPIARITEDENGTLVLSGREGLRKFVGGKIEPYALPGAKSEIPVRLLRSSDGNLWVGTVDRGLMHVHGGRTDWFEQSDGLTGNTVFAIFEDHEGNVWVGTNEGLDRFRDFAVPSLSSKQGLLDDGYSLVASSDGSVWIAS